MHILSLLIILSSPLCGNNRIDKKTHVTITGDCPPCARCIKEPCRPCRCQGSKRPGPPEVCDGRKLGKKTCLDFGFAGGSLKCSSDCTEFDTSKCKICRSRGRARCLPPIKMKNRWSIDPLAAAVSGSNALLSWWIRVPPLQSWKPLRFELIAARLDHRGRLGAPFLLSKYPQKAAPKSAPKSTDTFTHEPPHRSSKPPETARVLDIQATPQGWLLAASSPKTHGTWLYAIPHQGPSPRPRAFEGVEGPLLVKAGADRWLLTERAPRQQRPEAHWLNAQGEDNPPKKSAWGARMDHPGARVALFYKEGLLTLAWRDVNWSVKATWREGTPLEWLVDQELVNIPCATDHQLTLTMKAATLTPPQGAKQVIRAPLKTRLPKRVLAQTVDNPVELRFARRKFLATYVNERGGMMLHLVQMP